jgi:hypothetical protein
VRAALLIEVDKAIVDIEKYDRAGNYEMAHIVEDKLVAEVLAAALAGKTNWRTMARRTLDSLDRSDARDAKRFFERYA